MKTKLQKVTYWSSVITIGIVVGLTLQFAKAWTEPSSAPPSVNVGAPINTGSAVQYKSGNFDIGGTLKLYNISDPTSTSALSIYSAPNGSDTGSVIDPSDLATGDRKYLGIYGDPVEIYGGNSGNLGIYVNGNGNVGIGTNPEQRLHVNGTSYPWFLITGGNEGFLGLRAYSAAPHNSNLFFDNRGDFSIASQPYANRGTGSGETTRIIVKGSTGNVGIGKDPGEKLDVIGNIKSEGNLMANTICDSNGGNCKAVSALVTSVSAVGTVTGGCSRGTGWGTATTCGFQAGMGCASGNRAIVFNYCGGDGSCAWNSGIGYAEGICVKE